MVTIEDTFSVITTVKKWRYLIDNLKSLTNEAKFVFTPELMNVRAVDPAHVAAINLKTLPGYYEEFNVGKKIEFGFGMDKLSEKFRYWEPSTRTKLSMIEEHAESPKMKFEFFSKFGILVRHFHTIDTAGMPDPKIPELNLNKVEISPKALCSVYKHFGKICDHTTFRIEGTSEGNKLILEEANDTDDISIPLNICKLVKKGCSGKLKAKSVFSVDYVANALKLIHKADRLIVGLGDDNPMALNYMICKRDENKKLTKKKEFEATILLAPRIDSE